MGLQGFLLRFMLALNLQLQRTEFSAGGNVLTLIHGRLWDDADESSHQRLMCKLARTMPSATTCETFLDRYSTRESVALNEGDVWLLLKRAIIATKTTRAALCRLSFGSSVTQSPFSVASAMEAWPSERCLLEAAFSCPFPHCRVPVL